LFKLKTLLFLGCLLIGGLLVFNLNGGEAKGKEPLEFNEVEYHDLSPDIKSWVDTSRRQEMAQAKNFKGYTYILVTYGEKPTGGYTVEIKDLLLKEKEIEVIVEFKAPSADQMVTQAFTYPYALVRIEATDLPFSFTATGEKEYIMELRGIDRIRPIVASSNWIKIFNPAPEQEIEESFTVEGIASTFEGNIRYRLINAQGEKVKDSFTTAGMGDWYYFEIEMEIGELIETGEEFSLELFTTSPKDGAEENLVKIPLTKK